MRLWKLGRACALALLVWTVSLNAALAHALPGSVLTFSQDAHTVQLQIELALEDLVVASPRFDTLVDAPVGDLDAAALRSLNEYFEDHLKVLTAANAALSMQVESGTLSLGDDLHAGTFQLLTVLVTGQITNEEIWPIRLTYDAVMHEVRNHRASVFWQGSDANPVRLAEFGYAHGSGKSPSLVLDLE